MQQTLGLEEETVVKAALGMSMWDHASQGMPTEDVEIPPNNQVGEPTLKGREVVRGINSQVQIRGKVIELAIKVNEQSVSMLLDSGSTNNLVSAQSLY